jgi:RNA polymerase sigma-70 factor (ECF subfamily)
MTAQGDAGFSPGRVRLLAAQRGDLAAQSELFSLHKDAVARLVLRLTGDPAAVDDIVQAVFVAAFTALPGFRGDAEVETWLHTIAVNKTRTWWTAARRRHRREEHSGGGVAKEPIELDEDLDRERHLRRLYRALGGLPDYLREAFTLRIIEGASLTEASEVLRVPVSTVSYRTRRATRCLCEQLGIPFDAAETK